ncbi:MAG: DUF3592 domain-containing protein [Ruminococcus sp.]|uniref:DUF3592 domain-containing protein n=1 Tax=Ruminococcus sp. TaxID=41978 RepID=UPI0025EAB05A|nr:DUF3592 domain-containing protein [Ruminococcus sp.]MCR5600056.1 DUF3592 domain-containing protein [Ruminococcus sp.]
MNYNDKNNDEYNKYDDDKYDYDREQYAPSYDNGAAPDGSMYSPEEIEKVKKKVSRGISCVMAVFVFPFLLAGIIMLIIGTSSLISYYHAKGNCTELVTGVIESLDKWEHHDSDEGGRDSVSYAPIYSYTYNGKPYISKESAYSSKVEFSVGESVDIYVDPADPTTIFVPAYENRKSTAISFAVTGGIITLLFVLLIFKSGKLMIRKKSDMD